MTLDTDGSCKYRLNDGFMRNALVNTYAWRVCVLCF